MPCKSREEIVGKRFTSIQSDVKLKVSKISEWEWRSGFVRAVSSRDTSSTDFTVLIEFDDTGWKSREYVKVHEVFQEFLVEHTLSWIEREEPNYKPHHGLWPAICFRAIVDKAGLFQHNKRPVEFLSDRYLTIADEKDITYYKEGDENTVSTARECPDVIKWLKNWTDYQDGQKILLTTPTVLLGYRVEVYRTEGTTQWYTAVIKSYNHHNKSLTLTDDTVLEEHNEDPTLIQMHLIGDGVVDSILNGVDVGVAQRRRPRSTVTKQGSKDTTPVSSVNNRGVSIPNSNTSANSTNTSINTQSVAKHPNVTSSNTSSSNITSSPVATLSKVTGSSKTKSTPTIPSLSSPSKSTRQDSPGVLTAENSSTPSTPPLVNQDLSSKASARNQKQPGKRKTTDQLSKPSRKSPANRQPQKSDSSRDSLGNEPSPVCKQNCNVVVERIEEDDNKQCATQEKGRNKPSQLKNRDQPGKTSSPGSTPPIHCDETGKDSQVADKKQNNSKSANICDNTVSSLDASNEVSDASNQEAKDIISPDQSPIKDKRKKRSNALGTGSPYNSAPTSVKKEGDIDGRKSKRKSQIDVSVSPLITNQNDSKDNQINSVQASTNLRGKQQSGSKIKAETGKSCINEKNNQPRASLKRDKGGKTKSGSESENSKTISEEDMYYKKQILKAEGNVSPHNRSQTNTEGIDVTRSLTDQLAKRNLASNAYTYSGDPKSGSDAVAVADVHHHISQRESKNRDRPLETHSNNLSKTHDFAVAERQSAFTSVHSSSRSGLALPGATKSVSQDRADSRASDGQLSSHILDDKRPNSRVEDIRSVRSSPGSSPFVVDRSEAVHPYRDPELMRKNPVQSVQNIMEAQRQQQQKLAQSFPQTIVHPSAGLQGSSSAPATAPSPSAAAAAFAAAGVPSLPARSLLSALPGSTLSYATGHHQLPASMSHLSLPHGYQLEAVVRAQQQQQLAALQQQQLMSYSLGNPATRMTLDALWQRGKPPPGSAAAAALAANPWLLQKGGESLLAGELAFRDAQLQMQMEQERREIERREAERREIEKERLEIERREKERKEMIERERMEKEKMEREKAVERERQHIERERHQQMEREIKLEKERHIERERLERQDWEMHHKQTQERFLRATVSVDTEAAVDKHFEESLKGLAPQGLNMIPSMRGSGRGFVPKSESHHLPSFPSHGYDKLHDQRKDEVIKKEAEFADDKRFTKGGPQHPGFPFPISTSGYHPPNTSIGYQTASQKAVFSLYGYPTPPSTMTTEQLKQRGLLPVDTKHPVKEDPEIEKKLSYSSPPLHHTHHLSNNPYPHKDSIPGADMREHGSVIVKREAKPKMESPVAAHSHHHISPTASSSPRLQHPRPAHTPEYRPDRPCSSSSSPNTGIPPHLLASHHHSSPGPPHSASESHSSPRSKSPYNKPVGGQNQPQAMPIDFCKQSFNANQQSHIPGYPTSVMPQSTTVSAPSSSAYNYNLIQQGLVPNPIYSHGISKHSAGSVSEQQGRTVGPINTSSPLQPSQVSPPGNKRKGNSKEGLNPSSKKKSKGRNDVTAMDQHPSLPIPVTTPQILSNPSPYTTTSTTSSSFTRLGSNNHTPSSSSQAAPFSSLTIANAGNFQSFVNNTVNMAYLQDKQKKALEKAERERIAMTSQIAFSNAAPGGQPGLPNSEHSSSLSAAASTSHSSKQGTLPRSSTGSNSNNIESCRKRMMDTINRVATNQVDTDSDTLSGCSPPPQNSQINQNQPSVTKQSSSSGTASPLNRSLNSSVGSSGHPHHMKKAWLQRHDEDKKSETPPAIAPLPLQSMSHHQSEEESSNCSLSQPRDIISCVENSTALLGPERSTSSGPVRENITATASSPANVVVTLSNGKPNVNNHNESTSSASESERGSSRAGSKKRTKARKSGSVKKSKPDAGSDAPSPAPTPPPTNNAPASNSHKKTAANDKKGKGDKETKAKDVLALERKGDSKTTTHKSSKQSRDNSPELSRVSNKQQDKLASTASRNSALPSPAPCREDRFVPSPALSESSNMATLSPASSTSSSSSNNSGINTSSSKAGLGIGASKDVKDKKKTRKSKELASLPNSARDGKKSSSFNKPLVKMTVSTLKRTMVPFIQDGPCSEITPKLTKCRECKMTPVQRSKKQPNIFCRFYAFRRLKYNPRGVVTIDGFSELPDADPDDIEPWLPRFPVMEPDLDVENSKFIISKVGDKFCELVEQEREAKTWLNEDDKIVWKRAVMGVREMCDVCDTTLFNMHWVCQKCGFVVCLDCYKVRIKEGKKPLTDDRWLVCSSNKLAHRASEMMLTQIIPSDALWELGRLIHDIRIKWAIPSNCPCGSNTENNVSSKNGLNAQILSSINSSNKAQNGFYLDDISSNKQSNKSKKQIQQDGNPLKNLDSYNPDTTSSPLSILAEVASMEPDSNRDKVDSSKKGKLDKSALPGDDKKVGCSTLRELLTKYAGKPKVSNDKKAKKGSGQSTLDSIIQSVVEKRGQDGGAPFKFLHYTPRLGGGWKRELPIKIHSLTETSVLYPDVPHSWLCDGTLLRLHDAHHKGNLKIFQEQWKRGQPVLVSCANQNMNLSIWKPEMFSREFGHIENEVVNCRTGDTIIGHYMADFWDGFESFEARPVDENNAPMLLKLKDWPPGDDFSELLPTRFHDLMQALPLPEYTQRDGKLNLASRLPDFLVRPDLGPKMYNAYGSSQFPKEATTNLHLDISDAVNVMVYVGVPGDGPRGKKAQEEAALRAIDDAGCDSITKRRVREVHEIPGALWHIFDAHDADKIRDFLNKVAKERGQVIEADHDAIHDQSWYIDKGLCDRLLKEYGVQGYTIVQCHGDAIFIPAGAPHQVRNLHSCIKAAEDFVSPEHLNHCFRLTQEFRQLSETHSNHEDKLQVKNIIYHAVKDAVAVLRENDPEDE